jgi:hypothetical protein
MKHHPVGFVLIPAVDADNKIRVEHRFLAESGFSIVPVK